MNMWGLTELRADRPASAAPTHDLMTDTTVEQVDDTNDDILGVEISDENTATENTTEPEISASVTTNIIPHPHARDENTQPLPASETTNNSNATESTEPDIFTPITNMIPLSASGTNDDSTTTENTEPEILSSVTTNITTHSCATETNAQSFFVDGINENSGAAMASTIETEMSTSTTTSDRIRHPPIIETDAQSFFVSAQPVGMEFLKESPRYLATRFLNHAVHCRPVRLCQKDLDIMSSDFRSKWGFPDQVPQQSDGSIWSWNNPKPLGDITELVENRGKALGKPGINFNYPRRSTEMPTLATAIAKVLSCD